MMNNLFLPILKMSFTGGIVILAIMLIRLLLKRMPKIYSYILWSVAAFRLCCPMSLPSSISLFNLVPKESKAVTVNTVAENTAVVQKSSGTDIMSILSVVWFFGMVVFIIYSIISYYRLKVGLNGAELMYDNVYQAHGLSTPFVLGFMSPKIYLPYGLEDREREYILKHEYTHIKRADHIVKLLAFGILSVHWFNPLCWIAFTLMSRDMEMSCDEKVLSEGNSIKVYSSALLSMATNGRFPSPGPIAFGETSVKQRIKNILHWKKPAIWITVISVILCITAFTVFAADPIETRVESKKESEVSGSFPDTFEVVTIDTTTVDTTTVDTITVDTTTVNTTKASTSMIDTTITDTTVLVVPEPETTGDVEEYLPFTDEEVEAIERQREEFYESLEESIYEYYSELNEKYTRSNISGNRFLP